jgi:rfaE bifunctional protein kinase chain/domain
MFKDRKVLVVGDVMLDQYWFGEVTRISPEAPVPIVRIIQEDARPGGAANVARNISSLGGHATLLSVVGNDEPGGKLKQLLQDSGVSPDGLQTDPTISTIVKLRVLGGHQQLLRIDFEKQPSHEVLAAKLEEFANQVSDHDIVILSDYGKGGLTHIKKMISLAKAAGKQVLVDPKGSDYEQYSGASLITPNRSELRQVIGDWDDEYELSVRVKKLIDQLELDSLLLTRSEDGMSLFQKGSVFDQPALAQEVFDVSGAGDTVIATLALMLASHATPEDSVRVANIAAGIVVGKVGTAVVTADELRQLL